MNLTPAQQQAIAARGNVLVVAGAGTGKTKTLVERCLHCLFQKQPPAALDEILVVTFTDAAAAEMRQRIRQRLEEEWQKNPGDLRWAEQLALFDTAHIGTLHSFCLRLVRQHFYDLELDPQLTVLAEEEATLRAEETLSALLKEHYDGRAANAEAVQQLIQTQGQGWDQPVRDMVLRLHHYSQTLPDPTGWFESQLSMFAASEPSQWQRWLLKAVRDWRDRWLPTVQSDSSAETAELAAVLPDLGDSPSRAEAAKALERVQTLEQDPGRGKKSQRPKTLNDFFADAAFLLSLARTTERGDPLAEDWNWIRSPMTVLLRLTQEFGKQFSEAKRESGVVDFHDLEQHALQLLWDRARNQPTPIARQWRKKIHFVFVDEYQDINGAQDKIVEMLSREGLEANRFLVGDEKQSIYRFRLANPSIFQNYAETWHGDRGTVLSLADNFRSREAILNFVNSLFTVLMRRDISKVAFDELARLHFGGAADRHPLSVGADSTPHVELHLRLTGVADAELANDVEAAQAPADVADLQEAAKEARLVALRLHDLKSQRHQIWDGEAKTFRAVEWNDMAVLLRAPASKSEIYAKEFERLGVPLFMARGGFYQSLEVADLLCLLQLLDNPLQDVPALAVLRSPLVGLSLDELATVRLVQSAGHFWLALRRWHESQSPKSEILNPKSGEAGAREAGCAKPESARPETLGAKRNTQNETLRKVDLFLTRFLRWRKLARQVPLSRCLETVLTETHYTAWLMTQPRGRQRHANVQRLLTLAQRFDQFQRQGLFRFLRCVEAQQSAEAEPEAAPVTAEDAVSLMSIHQSKGLEFPVVVVADLGKAFNLADLQASIILDEKYGLSPQIKPPHTGQRYPSLPYWLARRRQKQELQGEELRLLYVAMTRARDTLILTGTVTEKKFAERWLGNSAGGVRTLLNARSYLDWLACWFAQNAGAQGETALRSGQNELLRWATWDDTQLTDTSAPQEPEAGHVADRIDPQKWEQLRARLLWQYPQAAATREPAKSSVTALRRGFTDETDEEASPLFQPSARRVSPKVRPAAAASGLSAAEIGAACHAFLQSLSLERAGDEEALRQEAERLKGEKVLSGEEIAVLDFTALASFWQSKLGRRIRAQAKHVRRELAFTARFAPAEIAQLTSTQTNPALKDEFIVVQGVADLVVLLPAEIWLVDFKTDQVRPDELLRKAKEYAPQLKLYAAALSRIYQRPVKERWLHFLALQLSVVVAN